MNKFIRIILVVALFIALGGCSNTDPVVGARTGECVVLLHGLARSSLSMEPMKWYLEENGYTVANIDYPSRDHEIDVLATLAVEDGLQQCASVENVETVHFVTHSLGGILVRYYFANNEVDFNRWVRCVQKIKIFLEIARDVRFFINNRYNLYSVCMLIVFYI